MAIICCFWFLVIHHQGEHDDEPPGSYLIETWDFVPDHAKRLNIYAENYGGMGINIALALNVALSAIRPSKHLKVYVRQTLDCRVLFCLKKSPL